MSSVSIATQTDGRTDEFAHTGDRQFQLFFFGEDKPELVETAFRHPINGGSRRAARGKTAGVFREYGVFQWTKAVRGISIIMLRAAIDGFDSNRTSAIAGNKGSCAASLDYALDKQPSWLVDMFGADQRGMSLAKRVLLRTNPGRKRPGPVMLCVNLNFLPRTSIAVFRDGVHLSQREEILSLLGLIENEDSHSRELNL